MSTATTLTITTAAGCRLPTEAAVREMVETHVEQGWPGGFEGDVTTREDELVVQWYDSRWSIDGLETVAEVITNLFPGVTVQQFEEWDTRDADEPGSSGWKYRGGQMIAVGVQRFVWEPVAGYPFPVE